MRRRVKKKNKSWISIWKGFLDGSGVKNPPACQKYRRGREGFIPGAGKIPWRRKMVIHSSVPAWKIQWAEEPGELQSKGSQRVRHNWGTKRARVHTHTQNMKRHLNSFVTGEIQIKTTTGFTVRETTDETVGLYSECMKIWIKTRWYCLEQRCETENRTSDVTLLI